MDTASPLLKPLIGTGGLFLEGCGSQAHQFFRDADTTALLSPGRTDEAHCVSAKGH
jgi:hypothetical protein